MLRFRRKLHQADRFAPATAQTDTSIVALASGESASIIALAVTSTLRGGTATDFPDPSDDPNAEIVRVTGVSGNTLTVSRGQEGTAASTKNTAGKVYKLMLGITAKMITDIGSNLQKPWRLVSVDGAIDGVNQTFTLDGLITPFDPNSMGLEACPPAARAGNRLRTLRHDDHLYQPA